MVKVQESQQINDLIFKELIKRGYSLQGNTRIWNIADSKLWYLTPGQAQDYLSLENSNDYQEATNQVLGEELMVSHVDEILDKIGKNQVNVIDLGCGDGQKAANLIKAFKGRVKLKYCPIDISGYMVSKAIETFSKLNLSEGIIQFQYNISDFENLENITPLLTKTGFKKNLFLLLGNTLGNFELHELLYEIRSAMKEGDILIIDTAVADKRVQERVQSQAKNQLVNKFLMHIPLQLGLNEDEIEYGARFRNSRIEFYYIIKRDKTIKFQNKKVDFNEGDQIIVALAYKHEKDFLLQFMKLYFGSVKVFSSKDESQCLFICVK